MSLIERLHQLARRQRQYGAPPDEKIDVTCDLVIDDLDEAATQLEAQQAEIERLRSAVIALADGADKCAQAPHFIVQPFLAIYREHGETIAEARASLDSQGK